MIHKFNGSTKNASTKVEAFVVSYRELFRSAG